MTNHYVCKHKWCENLGRNHNWRVVIPNNVCMLCWCIGLEHLVNDFFRSCRDKEEVETVLYLLGTCLLLCRKRKKPLVPPIWMIERNLQILIVKVCMWYSKSEWLYQKLRLVSQIGVQWKNGNSAKSPIPWIDSHLYGVVLKPVFLSEFFVAAVVD